MGRKKMKWYTKKDRKKQAKWETTNSNREKNEKRGKRERKTDRSKNAGDRKRY